MKHGRVIGVALACVAILWMAGRGDAARPANRYVGYKRCFTCHIDYANQWAKLAHSRILMKPGRKASESGCEACHGPGGRHVAGRETRSDIVRWKTMPAAQQTARCLACHGPAITPAKWKTSPHSKLPTSCLMCHEVHVPTGHPRNLKQPQETFCVGCHAQIPEMVLEKKHHPLPKGLRCSGCHDVHNAARPHLLRADKKTLCRQCHAPDGKRVRPASHRAEGWAKVHGKTAKADQTRCDVCHSREMYCNACHGTQMPHPEGFVMKHGAEAIRTPRTCARCHDQKKCGVCHQQLKPKSHAAEDFKKKHGATGVTSGPLCTLCHGPNSCNTCHGTPMPHPKDWVMTHKPKGATFAEDGLCLKRCHQKAEDCAKCHPDK